MSGQAAATVGIVNRKGLHARASAKLAKLAMSFQSVIIVSHEGVSADARSIMDLLMLIAHQGCELSIAAEGEDADAAVAALTELVASGFGELGKADQIY